MTTICPTITATSLSEYRLQCMAKSSFAPRLHVDVSDGVFAPRALVPLTEISWPSTVRADLHLMYRQPAAVIATLIALRPQLVIFHAEAQGSFIELAEQLHRHGIEVGVALLALTPVRVIQPALALIDHVLIFSGNLGYQGGSTADLRLLQKAKLLRQLKPSLEIGWDGGITIDNALTLARGGIDVLNVGGAIQNHPNQRAAYARLKAVIQ
jgi:pentose-5-phosphate-3-epimerase